MSAKSLHSLFLQLDEEERESFFRLIKTERYIIPSGYRLVPDEIFDRFMVNLGWNEIKEPTITEVAQYLGIGLDKIRKDQKKSDCPLYETRKGGKGRANQRRFLKVSVEEYKKWINK